MAATKAASHVAPVARRTTHSSPTDESACRAALASST